MERTISLWNRSQAWVLNKCQVWCDPKQNKNEQNGHSSWQVQVYGLMWDIMIIKELKESSDALLHSQWWFKLRPKERIGIIVKSVYIGKCILA